MSEFLAELSGSLPKDVVVWTGVEVSVSHLVMATGPDNRPTKPHRKTGLEIDSVSVKSEVRHEELTTADLANDSIAQKNNLPVRRQIAPQ